MPKPPRLPPPKLAPRQQLQPESAQPSTPPPPQVNEEELKARLEKSRQGLQAAVLEFKELLQKTQLASNRSTEDNRHRQGVIISAHDLAGQLEFLNAGEGLMTLCVTALHSSLLLKDEINDLKFQNAVLNKRLKALSEKVESGK